MPDDTDPTVETRLWLEQAESLRRNLLAERTRVVAALCAIDEALGEMREMEEAQEKYLAGLG